MRRKSVKEVCPHQDGKVFESPSIYVTTRVSYRVYARPRGHVEFTSKGGFELDYRDKRMREQGQVNLRYIIRAVTAKRGENRWKRKKNNNHCYFANASRLLYFSLFSPVFVKKKIIIVAKIVHFYSLKAGCGLQADKQANINERAPKDVNY